MNAIAVAADNTRSVIIEREFLHPPEKVWRALTQRELLNDWMMPNDFQAVVGHMFEFRTQPVANWDGVVAGEVLEVQPYSRLAYRWGVGADSPGAIISVVTLTLTPTAKGTHLRMEQSGFRPDQERNYQGANYGWQRFLGGLEKLLARIE